MESDVVVGDIRQTDIFFAVNRSNVSEVVAASNVILQFLLARLRQQHEHCTITKVGLAAVTSVLLNVIQTSNYSSVNFIS